MDDPLPADPAGADLSGSGLPGAGHHPADLPGSAPSRADLSGADPSGADLFWAVHDGLPRQAPGSEATVRLLLGIAGPLPARPRVVDIGCGTGPASMQLARERGADVVAVDTHAPFLARLRTGVAEEGLRVLPVRASMTDLPLADGAADLLWAEGSAYVMGVDAALV
ncbi:MAG TPA: methyltransferase domain-containing protein, partial [Pseudonocardia sp.]|nr:methyltransferase domain-containing protein [Pseudonocardia sp.]